MCYGSCAPDKSASTDKPCNKTNCKQYDEDFRSNCFIHTLRCVVNCKDFENVELDSFTNSKQDMGK